MSLDANIGECLLAGQQAGWRPATVRAYAWHLARWSAWCAAHGIRDPADLSRSNLRQWAAGLAASWSPATCKQAISAVRAFVAWWLTDNDKADASLLRALRSPRQPHIVQRTVTATEVAALLAACQEAPPNVAPDTADALAARNAAIIALLFDALLRAAELCALTLSDLDITNCRLLVRVTKAARPRLVPFSAPTADLLTDWLRLRPATSAVTVFVSLGGHTPGAPLTTRGLRIVLCRLAERAGVPCLSPHAFRRGGACELTLNGAPSRLVEAWAGWQSPGMLNLYTRGLEESQAAERFAAYSPMSNVRRA